MHHNTPNIFKMTRSFCYQWLKRLVLFDYDSTVQQTSEHLFLIFVWSLEKSETPWLPKPTRDATLSQTVSLRSDWQEPNELTATYGVCQSKK